MGYTPTRVDIRTEGWTTGTDMPLPRDCQTALCIHKDHQLTKSPDVALVTAFVVADEDADREPPNRGWVIPSPGLFPDYGPVDLPTVSINRGGLRFYPEFPECSFHITRRGIHWQIEVRFHGTQKWHKPPQLRLWRRKRAESMRAWLMSHQQAMRAQYIERANARYSF